MVQSKPQTSCLTLGCAAILLPSLGIAIIMGFWSAANGSKPSEAPRAQPPVSKPTSGGPDMVKSIGRQMTKTSNVHGVPLPADGIAQKGAAGGLATKVGTVTEITAFYRDWMPAHGWTFEPKYSSLDPAQGVAKSLGFTTTQIWCKPTKPITTVSIIVGSGDKLDHGKSAQIFISNLRNEDSCP